MTAAPATTRAADREQWRAWLAKNHDKAAEVWLVYAKKGSGEKTVTYDEAVEEALCFGWIDGRVKSIDEKHYMQRFSPRKPGSNWAESNRKRYANLVAEGRMTAAGLAKPPEETSRYTPSYERPAEPPPYLAAALKTNRIAWKNFNALAPSHRKTYIAWIDSAKREETRLRRIDKAIAMLVDNLVFGINGPVPAKKKT